MATAKPKFSFPKSRVPRRSSFADLVTLLYGVPKIGKSTFASNFPGAVFIPTEAGLNHLDVFQMPDPRDQDGKVGVQSLADFSEIIELLAGGGHEFETIVIDTIDGLISLVEAELRDRKSIETIGDLEFGKGYSLAKQAIEKIIRTLTKTGLGIVFTSHSVSRTFKRASGSEYDRIVPSIAERYRTLIESQCDLILFADQIEQTKSGKTSTHRVLFTKPTNRFVAGDRTGKLPKAMKLDFEGFSAAFTKAQAEADATDEESGEEIQPEES